MRREIAFCATRVGIRTRVRAATVRLVRPAADGERGTFRQVLLQMLSLLLGLSFAASSVLAEPITGEMQPDISAPLPLQDPAAPAAEPSAEGGADTTVVEISIVPSASDPNKMETVVIVQQQGGKNICLNQNNSDIISRNYLKRGDGPFDPAIPTEIRGLSSGDSGELVGFNDSTVFIKPNSPADEFTDTNECFEAAETEACFVTDGEECDQILQEGDLVCVGDGISDSGCPVTDHADLMRRLRVMVALNQPLGETPIITAADIAVATDLALPGGPGEPGGEPPSGPAPAGPTDGPVLGGGGSGGPNLITVPNVIGMTLAEASGVITAATLVVGNVTTQGQQTGLSLPSLIRTAHAQAACEPGTVIVQTPVAGTPVQAQTPVNLVLCAQAADIPEPASWVLFAMGLGMLILFTWSRRRLG